MKYCVLLVACCVMPALMYAQKDLDSLKNVYRAALSKSDNETAGYHATTIGNSLTMASQYDSAIVYFQSALRLSKRAKFIAPTLNSIGVAYNYKGYPDSCIKYYKESLTTYQSLKDTANMVTLEGNLAIVYKNIGWYDEALEASLGALRKLENKPADRTSASLYSTLGAVYLLAGDIARSIQHHKTALQIRKDIAFVRGVGQSSNNIGEAFIAMKEYDSALSYLNDAAQIKRQNENPSELGSTLNQIGRVYLLMGNALQAEQPLIEALTIKRAAGERTAEADIMNNLANLKMTQGRYSEARTYLIGAEDLLRKSSDLANLRRNLELEVILQKSLGNAEQALKYAEELMLLKDSLLNAEKVDIILALESRYEAEKKEKHILMLEKDKLTLDASVKARGNSIAVLIAVVSTMVLFLVFIFYQNRSLRAARDANRLLLEEVNHRVKNNLQIISTLFRIPYQDLEDSKALRLIKSGESRVNAMALIHRQLSDKTSFRTIQLGTFLSELVNYLDQSFGFSASGGNMKIDCTAMELDVDTAIPLSLIVNELLGNAMKHSRANQISVEVIRSGNGVEIDIRDNGTGYTPQQPASSGGFGLRLIGLMVKELRGTIQTNATKGTQTRINIPTL
jgi:two-component system, sensor histidine kinase PdtaS